MSSRSPQRKPCATDEVLVPARCRRKSPTRKQSLASEQRDRERKDIRDYLDRSRRPIGPVERVGNASNPVLATLVPLVVYTPNFIVNAVREMSSRQNRNLFPDVHERYAHVTKLVADELGVPIHVKKIFCKSDSDIKQATFNLLVRR